MFEHHRFPAYVRAPLFLVYAGVVVYLYLLGLRMMAAASLPAWGKLFLVFGLAGTFFFVALAALVRTYRGDLERLPAVAVALGGGIVALSTPTGVACEVGQGSAAGVQPLPQVVWNVGVTSIWGVPVPIGQAFVLNGGCRVEIFLSVYLISLLLLGWGAWKDPVVHRLIGRPATRA